MGGIHMYTKCNNEQQPLRSDMYAQRYVYRGVTTTATESAQNNKQ